MQRLYPHGCTAGVGPKVANHEPPKRGKVSGWSSGATRRNTRFLYSVEDDGLTGCGLAVTLTVRECPPSAAAWHALRRAWIERMRRFGMIRLHWVVEWQRRGVPHLHAAVYFDDAVHPMNVMRAWVEIAQAFGAGMGGQHVTPITDALGWRKYVSKHASRGVSNYQRSDANIPRGWQGQTGRVWGICGKWPRRGPVEFHLAGSEGDGAWFAFRRLVRAWRLSGARCDPDLAARAGRVLAARGMLRCSDRARSEVRGLSEWMEFDVQLRFFDALAGMGYSVSC